MKNIKLKIRIILVLLVIAMFYFIGESFASYATSVNGEINNNSNNQNIIAGFVINNRLVDNTSIDITDFNPGDSKDINFIVSNFLNSGSTTYNTDVSIKFKITISSTSLPLVFSLKQGDSTIPLTCSGTVNVNCYSNTYSVGRSSAISRNYTLSVLFPQNNSSNNAAFDYSYSNCLDVINLKIDSWQA